MARILIIDDEPAVRDNIGRYLERAGHEVFRAEDGAQGFTLLGSHSFDLVITDINMPEADGIEVINHLRDLPDGCPVIAISGGGVIPSDLLLGNARLLGAVHTLAKPFELAALGEAVDRALGAAPDDGG